MALTNTWNEATPAGSDVKSDGDNKIRELKVQLREFAQVDHDFPSTGSAGDSDTGYHNAVHLDDQVADPAAVAGVIVVYNKGGLFYMRVPDGTITQIGAGTDSVNAKTGDLLSSSVTTVRTGWTEVTGTYTGKFMRVGTSPLTAGGADTHTHTGPGHTHSVPRDGWGGSDGSTTSGRLQTVRTNGGGYDQMAATGDNSSGSGGTGVTGSGDNVPAHIQVTLFKKD